MQGVGNDFEALILEWNIEIPVDRWWRNKHGVAFNSALHREISFIDMYWEYLEDRLYERASLKLDSEDNKYVPDSHNFVVRRKVDLTMSEEDFDNIEI